MLMDSPHKITTLFNKGLHALRSNNYDYAIELFSAILEVVPEHKEARYFYLEALLSRFHTLEPKTEWISFFKYYMKKLIFLPKQIFYKIKRNYLQLLKMCDKLVKLSPNNRSLLLEMARHCETLLFLEAACSVYEILTRLNPSDIETLKRFGALNRNLDRPNEARKCYERVLAISPLDLEAKKGLQDIAALSTIHKGWKKVGTYRAKLADEEMAITLEKETHIRKETKDIDFLIQTLRKKLSENPDDFSLLHKLGKLYLEKGNLEMALDVFEKLANLNPADVEIKMMVRRIKLKQMDGKIARIRMEDPNSVELRRLEEEKEKFMIEDLKERIKEFPTYLPLRFELGKIYMQKGQLDEAIAEFQQSVRDPKFRIVSLNNLGLCFFKKGLYDLAIKQFERALKDLREWSNVKKEVVYNMGTVYEQMGEKQKALEEYKKIYEQDINYKNIGEKIAKLSS